VVTDSELLVMMRGNREESGSSRLIEAARLARQIDRVSYTAVRREQTSSPTGS
jgi:hypothetical protein